MKSFILFFKIIIPRITIPDKYIRMYKLINILYKNTTFKKYDIHTNINATLSVLFVSRLASGMEIFMSNFCITAMVTFLGYILLYGVCWGNR